MRVGDRPRRAGEPGGWVGVQISFGIKHEASICTRAATSLQVRPNPEFSPEWLDELRQVLYDSLP